MSIKRRIILLIGGIITFSMGLWGALQTELPFRASYTGYVIPESGLVAPEVHTKAPPFTLPNLNGDTVALEEFLGQPVILNFWATWCIPCRVEMPILQRVHTEYGPDTAQIIAVNVGESAEEVQAWAEELQLSYPLLLDPQSQIAQRYHLRGQPSTYIIGPDGVISQIFHGPVTEESLTRALAVHLSD